MTGDVISLGASCAAILPFTSETKIIGAFATDVVVAEVVIEDFGLEVRLAAVDPKTGQGGLVGGGGDRRWLLPRGRGLRCGVLDLCRLWGWGGGGCCGHGSGVLTVAVGVGEGEGRRAKTERRKGGRVSIWLETSWCLYNLQWLSEDSLGSRSWVSAQEQVCRAFLVST